jgi:hypothetical protein
MAEPGSLLDELHWRDEILQVMYWMLGEGLGDRVTAADLARFLAAEAGPIAAHLRRMADEGDLEVVGGEGAGRRYKLTVYGAREGGRRFADEFAGMQFGGHGECNRPGCACLELGPEACVSRVEQRA